MLVRRYWVIGDTALLNDTPAQAAVQRRSKGKLLPFQAYPYTQVGIEDFMLLPNQGEVS